ncbi:hypothetical protein [Rummeliibacillus stabekisii]|uniref:ArpU family transcriptional regulator n=1 Tax=Rummeliibacillus stabekisii TaxID=241244 RepID=A0A143HCN7_9BACL|nr:hypothetical protein [Rummeliibacillus stabekisii]AMW98436.1 hypothetical protein ATY39_02705 [Rummeliibacillus stabekisii]AMW99220.1 hypothetical protein ATY39_06925 [Rummeliibacillus stabekisii]
MELTEKQLEIVARTAAAVAVEKYQAEQQEREKHKHDRRLRNIKLLLRNYRWFATHSADIKLDIVELDEKLELDDLDTDEFAVMSIKKSKKKTLAMVKFINKTLEIYKLMCEESGNVDDIRKYETIYHMYISEEKKTVAEISNCQFANERTVYRNAQRAYEDLAVLIFGVDGIRF